MPSSARRRPVAVAHAPHGAPGHRAASVAHARGVLRNVITVNKDASRGACFGRGGLRARLQHQLAQPLRHACRGWCRAMAYIVMDYIVMAYAVMAYIVMAYIVMAYIVMAYVVDSSEAGHWQRLRRSRAITI